MMRSCTTHWHHDYVEFTVTTEKVTRLEPGIVDIHFNTFWRRWGVPGGWETHIDERQAWKYHSKLMRRFRLRVRRRTGMTASLRMPSKRPLVLEEV